MRKKAGNNNINLQKKVQNKAVSMRKGNATVNNNSKSKSSTSNNGFYYSFMTIVLLLCLLQITVSAVLNISKIVSHKAKIIQLTKTRDAARALNEQLHDNIKNFSNVSGLEEIARNNLKMTSEDEVLVIINSPKEPEKEEEKGKVIGFKRQND